MTDPAPDFRAVTASGVPVHCSHAAIVDIADLRPNPRNPNRHGDEQVALLAANIRALGWRHPVIVSKRSGLVVAGHARIEAARLMKVATVPVDYQDFVSDDEETAYLVADNRIAELAERDNAAIKDLLEELDRGQKTDAGQLLADLTGYCEAERERLANQVHQDGDENKSKDERGVFALREDAVFQIENRWGIAQLLPDMLADVPPPRSCWTGGEAKEPGQMMLYGSNAFPNNVQAAILAFYVDDYRFEVVWSDAVATMEKLRKVEFAAVVTPDFSVWRDDPPAVQLWNIYRSRWVARYWQECGMKIVPSLNWADEQSYDFAFLGLPIGAPVVSCQCRTTRSQKGLEFFCRGLAHSIEMLKPLSVWVYGGNEHRATLEPLLPGATKYEWLQSRTEARRKDGLK